MLTTKNSSVPDKQFKTQICNCKFFEIRHQINGNSQS